MKANEIRLGNYLEMLGKVRKVECISNLPARKEMYWLACENMIDTKIIHFSPIPLTEEWLLKFGFTENSYYNLKSTGGTDYIFGYKKQNYTSLRYVHQLQNLYFALTGEELTYENETK